MPYNFVAAGPGSTAGTNFARTISATFAAGETVFVVAGNWGFPGPGNPQCSDGVNTYTRVALFGTSGWVGIWKADNVQAGTVTITVTAGSEQVGGLNFFRYTGLASGAVQAANGRSMSPNGAGGSDNVTGLSLTPTAQPAMLFAACWRQNSGADPTAGTDYTSRGAIADTPNGRVQDLRITSTSGITPTFTTTNTFEDFQVAGVLVSELPDGQILRPASDVSAGLWLPSSGLELAPMIDEAVASDADVIFTQDPAATCTIALQAGNDPNASAGHMLRYRLRGDGQSGVRVELLQSATVIASWTHDPAPVGFTAYQQTLTGTQADAITNYGALRLRFTEV